MPYIAKLTSRRNHTWVEITTSCGQSIKLPLDEVPHTLVADAKVGEGPWQKLCAQSEFAQLYDKALHTLGRREYFASELVRKLMQKSPNREVVEQVVALCVERGYLDETRAAEQIVAKLTGRGGVGLQRVRQELMRSGCPRELLDSTMEQAEGRIDENIELANLLQSRKRTFQGKLDRLRRKPPDGLAPAQLERQIKQKLGAAVMSFLLGRGFRSDLARNSAREFVDEMMGEE